MNTNDIWLIAGLGNPETKYDGTRHNAGYAALDYLADKWGISVSKTKFEGLWGQGEVDGHKVVLLKPLTYMNLSGDSIAPTAGFFKIPADHVIVLCGVSERRFERFVKGKSSSPALQVSCFFSLQYRRKP